MLDWLGGAAYLPVLFLVPNGAGTGAVLVVSVAASGLLLGLLRRQPLAAMVLLLAASFLVTTATHAAAVGAVQLMLSGLAIGYVAATRQRWISIATAALACLGLAGTVPYLLIAGVPVLVGLAVVFLAVLTAWLVGHSIRQHRESTRSLQSQTTAQAVMAERLRIARELHDVVAHSVGIIAIQSGMGHRVMDTQPDQARNALATVEALSRETLARLRHTVGALRGQDTEPAPLGPAPGLDDLDQLTATAVRAGVRVELAWRGERRPVPAEVDLSAYRIVQESLTNIIRHAAVSRCRVIVEYRPDDLLIQVVDDGRARGDGAAGFGITGMRERVELLNGEFTAGPRPEGGFCVAARLPTPAGVP
jgi:signal transduction histidine kinase